MARAGPIFLIKKLGLSESDGLDAAIDKAIETYGRSDRSKYRAVICTFS